MQHILQLASFLSLHIHIDHLAFHTKLAPMVPFFVIHHVVFGAGIVTGTGQFGSGSNGQLILTLVLLLGVIRILWMRGILHSTTGSCTTSKKCSCNDCSGCHGDSKRADIVRRCFFFCILGRSDGGGSATKIGNGRNFSIVRGNGEEGGDFGQEEGFFVGGDGTDKEDGNGSFDHVTVCSRGRRGAGVCAK